MVKQGNCEKKARKSCCNFTRAGGNLYQTELKRCKPKKEKCGGCKPCEYKKKKDCGCEKPKYNPCKCNPCKCNPCKCGKKEKPCCEEKKKCSFDPCKCSPWAWMIELDKKNNPGLDL